MKMMKKKKYEGSGSKKGVSLENHDAPKLTTSYTLIMLSSEVLEQYSPLALTAKSVMASAKDGKWLVG